MDIDKKTDIHLNDQERRLFELFKAVEAHYELKTVMRVAGGWVRDKIMGLDSHDIDIALDNMNGNAFAQKVNDYLASKGEEVHSIGVIQSNPDQSKHLETATVKVFGSWIDFVNLRSETYTEDSRIPSAIEIGTPEQDANRRDLTINALFYNINLGVVEDFTGCGIADIENKIIRTPLPPLQTFTDDPLRVLRALRFAARLEGFKIEPELLKAASDPIVTEALAKKIARERIGKELDGIIRAPRVKEAIVWLVENELYPVVFSLPSSSQLNTPIDIKRSQIDSIAYIYLFNNLIKSYPSALVDAEEKRIAALAAVLMPFSTSTYTTSKKRVDSVSNYIMLESIKYPKADADMIQTLHFGALHFAPLFSPTPASNEDETDCSGYLKNEPLEKQLVKLGRVMRRLGNAWVSSLVLACAKRYTEHPFIAYMMEEAYSRGPNVECEEVKQRLDSIQIDSGIEQLQERIIELGMDKAAEMKPFFSGDDLKSMLSLSPGPIMGVALDKEIDWMLEHIKLVIEEPQKAKEECKQYLLSPALKEHLSTVVIERKKK